MRLTYLDDSGLFNAAQEPFVVVGGVIVDADRQLVAIENYIDTLIQRHIPEEDQYGFVFHAMELWHGSRYFVRDKWPREKRLEILSDLVEIPARFDFPVSFGYTARENIQPFMVPKGYSARDKEIMLHAHAFARFCETVEMFMREVAGDEITLLIAEDNDAVRRSMRAAHTLHRDPQMIKALDAQLVYFPFEKIRDTVHFAGKTESKHLQIADVCTFIIKRHLMKDPVSDSLYEALKPQMVVLLKGEVEAEQFS